MDKAIIAIDALAFCLAYTIPISKYLGLGNKKVFRVSICFCALLFVELCCKFFQPILTSYSFYICGLIVSFLVRRECGFLKGLNISVTILTILICGVAFVGAITFKIFPDKDLYYNLIFNIFMDLVLLILAVLMTKFSKFFFRQRMSKTLVHIDVAAKIAFSLFINLFLPMFFLPLGKEKYAEVLLTFLVFSILFFIHMSYSQNVENRLRIKDFQIEMLHEKTHLATEKYQELIEIKASANPDDRRIMKAQKDSAMVQSIDIPVIQALLYELMDLAGKQNNDVVFYIEPVSQPNSLSDCDLYAILDTFIKNALRESVKKSEAVIKVWINTIDNVFVFRIESVIENPEAIYRDINRMKEIIKSYKNIVISVQNMDKLVQCLEVI